MSNPLLEHIMRETTESVMLSEDKYQGIVVEYSEYFKATIHGLHSGMLNPRHIRSFHRLGISREKEMRSHICIRDALKDVTGHMQINIIRCNPSVCYQLIIKDEVKASLLVSPEAMLNTLSGNDVDYDKFNHGFMLYSY